MTRRRIDPLKCFSVLLKDDQTALHISSRLGKIDIVQQLLQCGASANAATTSGYTPLHLAAREGHQDVAVMLLENGASLSSSTKVSQGFFLFLFVFLNLHLVLLWTK